MAGAGVISCPACGASYPWKPQLAGKKVRCKCGKSFEATPPKVLPAEVEEPDIFALEEDAPPPKKLPPLRMPPSPAAPAAAAPRAATTMSPAPAAGGSGIASAYPTRGRRTMAQEADAGESKRKLVVPLAILTLLVGVGIFAGIALKGSNANKRKPLGDDAKIIDMIEDEGGTEVKEWIRAHNRHMIHNMTEGQVIAFADRLYAMGAKKVYAFGEVISASLAVELPDDPAQRKKLFEFEREHNGLRSKTSDVGQQYFLLYMF